MRVKKLIEFLEGYSEETEVYIIDEAFNKRIEILELDDFNGPVLVMGKERKWL